VKFMKARGWFGGYRDCIICGMRSMQARCLIFIHLCVLVCNLMYVDMIITRIVIQSSAQF